LIRSLKKFYDRRSQTEKKREKAMAREEKIEEIRQRARKNFSLGYNCAECVTQAVFALVDTGLPPAVQKCATGFGGGIGLFGDTCGALNGAVMAVSAVHGRALLPEGNDPKEVVKKSRQQLYGKPGVYRIFNQIPTAFRKNSIIRNAGSCPENGSPNGSAATTPFSAAKSLRMLRA
jgi:C_GCAxxG_C_C family probable redox protein